MCYVIVLIFHHIAVSMLTAVYTVSFSLYNIYKLFILYSTVFIIVIGCARRLKVVVDLDKINS